MIIGILAIQGDYTEHAAMIRKLGAAPVLVKLPEDLEKVAGLIIPGGESTVIGKSLRETGLGDAIIARAQKGMPIYGTCAGAILLAKTIAKYPHQYSLKLMDIEIDRNTYGRQTESSRIKLAFNDKQIPVTLIRAPTILKTGKNVQTLVGYDGEPFLVQEGNLMAGTFHPELDDMPEIHRYFLELCK